MNRKHLFRKIWSNHGGDQPHLHLAQAKTASLFGQGDIAAGDEAHRSAICGAVNQRQSRHGELVKRFTHIQEFLRLLAVLLQRHTYRTTHPIKIGTGREVPPRPQQHKETAGVVTRGVGEDRPQLIHHAAMKGVRLGGTVQNHRPYIMRGCGLCISVDKGPFLPDDNFSVLFNHKLLPLFRGRRLAHHSGLIPNFIVKKYI